MKKADQAVAKLNTVPNTAAIKLQSFPRKALVLCVHRGVSMIFLFGEWPKDAQKTYERFMDDAGCWVAMVMKPEDAMQAITDLDGLIDEMVQRGRMLEKAAIVTTDVDKLVTINRRNR